MCGQAIVAPIHLGNGERNPFAGLGVQRARKSAIELECTRQGGRAQREQAEEIGDGTELRADRVEQRARLVRGSVVIGDVDASHDRLLMQRTALISEARPADRLLTRRR